MDPVVNPGDYICLIRRDYTPGPPPSPVPTGLNIGWFEVRNVDNPPRATGSNTFESTVTVTGGRWTFHPIQEFDAVKGSGPYLPGASPPGVGTIPQYTGTDVLYGTVAVLMRNVVAVQRFP